MRESPLADRRYLLDEQYRDATNLSARQHLHEHYSTNPTRWHPWVFDQLSLPPECHILELGCGPGALWQANLERIPMGWQITLSDLSHGMLAEARRRLQPSGQPFRFAQADAQAIPFADATFEAVIANHMLYHVPDRPKALAEIRRVLAPGGRLYAATNGRAHMRDLNALVSRVAPEAVQASGAAEGFWLENGAAQLEPFFPRITLRRYEDGLVVREVEPLVAYVLSGMRFAEVPAEKRESLWQLFAQEIARDGAIRIAKDAGLFEAGLDDKGE